jgi:hypothetical protein
MPRIRLPPPCAHLSLPHPLPRLSPHQVRMVSPRPLLIICLREPVSQNISWWALEQAGMAWGTHMGLGQAWLGPPARLPGYPPPSLSAAVALSRSNPVQALWERAEGVLWEEGNRTPRRDLTAPPDGTIQLDNSLAAHSPAGNMPGTMPASNSPGRAGGDGSGRDARLTGQPSSSEAPMGGGAVSSCGAPGDLVAGRAGGLGAWLLRLLSRVLAPGPALLLPAWAAPCPNGQLSAFDRMGRFVDNVQRWAEHFGEWISRSPFFNPHPDTHPVFLLYFGE